MDEVATQNSNIVSNKTIAADGERSGGVEDGRKRAGKEMEPKEERKRKRVKVDEGLSDKIIRVSIKKTPKPKVKRGQAQSRAAIGFKENFTAFTELRWNLFQPIKMRTPPKATQSQEQPPLTNLKPRIWTSSREELIELLPDLAGPKCLNGVSWLMYETPMILLDDSTTCFDISLQEDSVTLDLLTARDFTCIWPPRPDKVPDPSGNLTVNSTLAGNLSTLDATADSSSKRLLKMHRTEGASTAVRIPVAGSMGLTQTPPEGGIPLPTYTPHEPSTEGFKATGSGQFVTPSLSTYSQGRPAVESAGGHSGTSNRVPSGPFRGLVMERGRRIKAAETSDALIDLLTPSMPGYSLCQPTAGGFSEHLRNVHNKGIGNTATKCQHKASSNPIRPKDLTTKSGEQNYSTHALMSTGPSLQGREIVNGCSSDPITTTVLDHQFQGYDIDQIQLKNPPPTYCTSSRSGEHASSNGPHDLMEPLPHHPSAYETKYTVTTNTTYTTPDSVDKLLTQAIDTFSAQHSPSSDHVEPGVFESSTRTVTIPVDEVTLTQLSANVALNTGPAPQVQNDSLSDMKSIPPSAVPNNQIAVTKLEPDLNGHHSPKLSQPTSSANRCDNPLKQILTFQTSSSEVVKARRSMARQTLAGSKKRGTSQFELKPMITNRPEDQPITPIDLQVGSKPEVGLQATEIVGPTDCVSNEDKVEQIRIVKALQDAFIPSTIPEEIQAIIDSYLSGRPVLLVISNQRFFDYWSLRLPEEFGFSMLGYFRILGVQESRVHLNDPVCPLRDSSGSIAGRVEWRFRLQWSPGGEEWILPKHDKNLLEHPWWKPPPLSTPPLEARIRSSDTQPIISHAALGVSQEIPGAESTNVEDRTAPFEPESTFDTTPRYRAARLSNVNYEFRHTHLRELYHSHVPLQLLAPYGPKVLDSSFPRGWLCETCGKMNFQAALRHRACSSSFCKGLKPEIASYAIDLTFMREPQDKLSMVLPYNEPLLINLVDTWEDGTRTLPYYIHDDENIFIKHIFTRNLPPLQLEATRLLHLIQIDVELVRSIGENSPYFQYSAHAPKDDPSPTTSEWPNVPLCIYHAKDWTQHQARWFGELEKEQLSINHICLLAWVTSGTKRGPAIIRAKEKCVVFHAFGCNITILVTPLSSKATVPVKIEGAHLDSLIAMDELPLDEPDVNPGWIAGFDEENDAVEDPSQEDKETWPATNSKKTLDSKHPFLFTLVHGDVLVFYGDDFEYSLKREGTSFLLIASHQNEPQE